MRTPPKMGYLRVIDSIYQRELSLSQLYARNPGGNFPVFIGTLGIYARYRAEPAISYGYRSGPSFKCLATSLTLSQYISAHWTHTPLGLARDVDASPSLSILAPKTHKAGKIMPRYSNAASCGRADNWASRLNTGYFRGYNGTPPADADTALAGNTLLIENRFSATAFPASSGHGATTSNALTVVNAIASGTPTFYRGYASDGTTCVAQWNTTDVTISPTSVTAGVSITVNPIVHTEAAGT